MDCRGNNFIRLDVTVYIPTQCASHRFLLEMRSTLYYKLLVTLLEVLKSVT